jgi:hypothetical protein
MAVKRNAKRQFRSATAVFLCYEIYTDDRCVFFEVLLPHNIFRDTHVSGCKVLLPHKFHRPPYWYYWL